jgi:DNA adenine methylase
MPRRKYPVQEDTKLDLVEDLFNPLSVGAKPFLKWAGGKSQLIPAISKALPLDINERKSLTYVEPFVGSGAVMFWFLQRFPNVQKAIINDINPDLYKAYTVIKQSPEILIKALTKIQGEYRSLKSEEDRRKFFLEKRHEFNLRNLDDVHNTTLLVFLNKTCFNGLYRVNSGNGFNVPFGKYENPNICDAVTIRANSQLLQKVTIINDDYTRTLENLEEKAFFYFDPPYKPISKTSSFNAYSANTFDDSEQERLAAFCRRIDSIGHEWILSNSDLKNVDIENHYFENLYNGFEINRVKAKRFINSDSTKRGHILELLITNYATIAELNPLI